MTTSKSNTVSLSAKEWVSGDRDLMKALMKEALQEVLEGEMTGPSFWERNRESARKPETGIGRATTTGGW